ncbi:hypothetical protein BC940DRAFT_300519 [Gongronella butleri]|nr:hypothetical protein BC940DRAFT_300519 [Gongronella butleri]
MTNHHHHHHHQGQQQQQQQAYYAAGGMQQQQQPYGHGAHHQPYLWGDLAAFAGSEALLQRYENQHHLPHHTMRDLALSGAAAYGMHQFQKHDTMRHYQHAHQGMGMMPGMGMGGSPYGGAYSYYPSSYGGGAMGAYGSPYGGANAMYSPYGGYYQQNPYASYYGGGAAGSYPYFQQQNGSYFY